MAEDPRAHHAQVPGALRGSPQEPPGQGGSLPVQEHLPAGVWGEIRRVAKETRFFFFFLRQLNVCLCFQVNIKSLEDVVRAYLKLAEEKTETAKEESQQMVLDIEDLDNIQTPERLGCLNVGCRSNVTVKLYCIVSTC